MRCRDGEKYGGMIKFKNIKKFIENLGWLSTKSKNHTTDAVVKATVQSGWSAKMRELPPTVAIYWCSNSGWPRPFESTWFLLHSSHQGIKSKLRRARETIYWPNIEWFERLHFKVCKGVRPTAQDSRRRHSSVMTFRVDLGPKFPPTCST